MHKYKSFFIRTAKIIFLIFSVVSFILIGQHYFFRAYDDNLGNSLRVEGFEKEPKNSLNVVLIGDSFVYTGFSPALAYKEYGYTSYDYAISSNIVTNWQTQIERVLEKQKPDLFVFEVYGCLYGMLDKEAPVHQLIDMLPYGKTKRNAVEHLKNYKSDIKEIYYYIPFFKYHSAWKRFSSNIAHAEAAFLLDIRGKNDLKGLWSRTGNYTPVKGSYFPSPDSTKGKLHKDAKEELQKILLFCKENNLEVLFINMPHVIDSKTKKYLNENYNADRAGELIKKHGYNYLNLNYFINEIGIDSNTDFYNGGHTNLNGTKKVTKFLSEYILKNYQINKTQLDEKTKKLWNKSVICYEQFSDYFDKYFLANIDKKIDDNAKEWRKNAAKNN